MENLSSENVQAFYERGFLLVRKFLPNDAVQQISNWVTDISTWPSGDGPYHQYREMTKDGPVLARTERFLSCHEGLADFLQHGPVVTAISQMFQEPAQVFKEKINYKNPGGGGFVPHQDAAAYGEHGSYHITCLIPIDANTIENGCLWFAPGPYRQPLLPDNGFGCLDESCAESLSWEPACLDPGDVLFFSSYVAHKSGPNETDRSRTSLYVTYGMASEGALRDAYYEERQQIMAEGDSNRISTIAHFKGRTIE